MDRKIEVFIKIDENNIVIDVQSSIELNNTENWIKIDEGYGDRYALAQTHYLPKGKTDENGRNNYKYVDELIELTEEEKEILYPPIQPQPTEQEKINAMMMLEIVKLKSTNVPVAINIVDNSILLETLKSYYALGLFTDSDIKMFILVGDITPEEYKNITGKEYKE